MVSTSCGSPGFSQASGGRWFTWSQAAPSQQLVPVDTVQPHWCLGSRDVRSPCTTPWADFGSFLEVRKKPQYFLRAFITVYAVVCGSWLRREQGEPALNLNTCQKTCSKVVQTLAESRSNWRSLWANSVSVTWKWSAQTPWNKRADYFDI